MEEKRMARIIKGTKITTVDEGDVVYVDLRQYSVGRWYDDLPMEDRYHKKYVLQFEYERWYNDEQKKIWIYCPLNYDGYYVDHLWIKMFGATKVFDPGRMILIDEHFVLKYPEITTSASNRERVMQRCRDVLGI
jgi:hypothetical protein